jgi:predicted dehydrogenase
VNMVGRDVDAVIVSTPDHIHAPAAVRAMRMGKHVYCQKPLTHTVAEARLMRDVARQQKVATQMGNQGHSNPETRRLVEIVRSGALGKVSEIHVWTDRPIWPQGLDRPAETQPVPQGLDWDLWLGPAPQRAYNRAYLPFNWRGWLDFGTGALGDMACHCMDLAFFALNLPAPRTIAARSSGCNGETYPNWSVIDYEFPAKGEQPAVKMTWYDGHKQPPAEMVKQQKLPTNGIILVGDRDTLYVPNYWGEGSFVSGATMNNFKNVPQSLPRTAGFDFDVNHYAEWLNGCRGGPKPLSNFVDYAGPLTEAVLLGNVAVRAGRKIEWDAENLKVTNSPEANRLLTKEYRKGWEVF